MAIDDELLAIVEAFGRIAPLPPPQTIQPARGLGPEPTPSAADVPETSTPFPKPVSAAPRTDELVGRPVLPSVDTPTRPRPPAFATGGVVAVAVVVAFTLWPEAPYPQPTSLPVAIVEAPRVAESPRTSLPQVTKVTPPSDRQTPSSGGTAAATVSSAENGAPATPAAPSLLPTATELMTRGAERRRAGAFGEAYQLFDSAVALAARAAPGSTDPVDLQRAQRLRTLAANDCAEATKANPRPPVGCP